MLKAIVFDLGNTLIKQRIDKSKTLDKMDLELLPDVFPTLNWLKKNYKLAILSNTVQSSKRHASLALKKLGIKSFFSTIITSVHAGFEKPDPKIFQYLLDEMQIHPSQALMVGNDINADIAGAKNIGMKTVFFSIEPDDWEKKSLSKVIPDYEISHISQLIKIVQEIEAEEMS